MRSYLQIRQKLMARSLISPEQWEKAKEYFEHGLTLKEISDKTGITRGAISKKSKSEEWNKESSKKQLLSQAVEVTVAKETLKETPVALEVHQELHDEKVRREKLVYGNAELIASMIPTVIKNFEVETVDKKTGDTVVVNSIQPNDMKTLAEANDKLAITLKVADRHAPKIDVTQMQQATSGDTTILIQEDKVE
jgi:predicted DNA-binding protein YlxM (UPF0122 family)